MTEDIKNGFVTLVNQRLSSPVVFSFIVAWCLWNYTFLMVLFSANTVTETMNLVHRVAYPSFWVWLRDGVICPCLSAAGFLFCQPLADRFVLSYQWRERNKTNRIFLNTFNKRTVQIEESLRLSEQVESLKEANVTLQRDNTLAKDGHQLMGNKISDQERIIKNLENKYTEIKDDLGRKSFELDEMAAKYKYLKHGNFSDLTKEERVLLVDILHNVGEELRDVSTTVMLNNRPVFENMVDFGYLTRNEKNDGYVVTEKGKDLYKSFPYMESMPIK